MNTNVSELQINSGKRWKCGCVLPKDFIDDIFFLQEVSSSDAKYWPAKLRRPTEKKKKKGPLVGSVLTFRAQSQNIPYASAHTRDEVFVYFYLSLFIFIYKNWMKVKHKEWESQTIVCECIHEAEIQTEPAEACRVLKYCQPYFFNSSVNLSVLSIQWLLSTCLCTSPSRTDKKKKSGRIKSSWATLWSMYLLSSMAERLEWSQEEDEAEGRRRNKQLVSCGWRSTNCFMKLSLEWTTHNWAAAKKSIYWLVNLKNIIRSIISLEWYK